MSLLPSEWPKVSPGETKQQLKKVFHAWLYGIFVEIQSNLRRKKLHRTNQCNNFPGGSFSNGDNARAPIQFRRESQPRHLKSEFSSRTDPSVLLDRSNKTSSIFPALKSTSHFLAHSTVSRRSD